MLTFQIIAQKSEKQYLIGFCLKKIQPNKQPIGAIDLFVNVVSKLFFREFVFGLGGGVRTKVFTVNQVWG
jgi:hypothetical protein